MDPVISEWHRNVFVASKCYVLVSKQISIMKEKIVITSICFQVLLERIKSLYLKENVNNKYLGSHVCCV